MYTWYYKYYIIHIYSICYGLIYIEIVCYYQIFNNWTLFILFKFANIPNRLLACDNSITHPIGAEHKCTPYWNKGMQYPNQKTNSDIEINSIRWSGIIQNFINK